MRGCVFRFFGALVGLLLLSFPLSAQSGMGVETSSRGESNDAQIHLGFPQDWSSRHLLMPGARPEDALAAASRDPRHVYNLVMRQLAADNLRRRQPVNAPTRRMNIDWAVSLENGYVPANQFPAKYGFTAGAESCTTDYVVFALTVTSV